MKAWKLLFLLPLAAAVAMVPQNQEAEPDIGINLSIAELRWSSLQGTQTVVPARNVAEIRFLDDSGDHIRLELVYDNGDYSLIDAQSFDLIRTGNGSREVRLVRGKGARMRFPRLP